MQSPRECRGAGEGGLFPQTVKFGNAESTHVYRPKGKATLVPKVGKCCNIEKITYMIRTCDEDALPGKKNLVLVGIEHGVPGLSPYSDVERFLRNGGRQLQLEVEAQPVPQEATMPRRNYSAKKKARNEKREELSRRGNATLERSGNWPSAS